ncbi:MULTISPECIES: hypothetical protein [unclassified Rhizobium]|uniref:hypothetical protein n=1 Tax=unclassified Rhizobium TaxID=2613769 RepID=UPI00161EEEE0|nr:MULTISPECIES: hypothetical protein [unclassified Rhizobium]MBB3543312.1 hypothetical protein [Rhizobium sp. BK399]MCS3741676.1 hypothetical protein [Rhizobium sp. BK661]MCS4093601.1 hypothetical protein [Rhizobium sp. BK176]
MRLIEIDSLDEAALVELNARIVERLQLLHHQRTAAALQDIRVGSGVTFEGPGGVTIRGVVIRRNKKTVTVHADDERQWNVSPTLLTLTGSHVLDTLDDVVTGKPDRTGASDRIVAFPNPDRR